VTYWEYNQPHDQQLHAIDRECCIYQSANKNKNKKSSLCLNHIQSDLCGKEVPRVRSLIGDGIKIRVNKVNKTIELENNCLCPVYWLCPTVYSDFDRLDCLNSTHRSHKSQAQFEANLLAPNQSTFVFSHDLANSNNSGNNSFLESNLINVSFAKYWGWNSPKRQSIEYCPCWINISIDCDYFKN
jgi:hypothetical protein